MNFDELTPEQQERIQACTTPEEVFALAREQGHELTEEEIDAISGGDNAWGNKPKNVPTACPNCGSQTIREIALGYTCHDCGKHFE